MLVKSTLTEHVAGLSASAELESAGQDPPASWALSLSGCFFLNASRIAAHPVEAPCALQVLFAGIEVIAAMLTPGDAVPKLTGAGVAVVEVSARAKDVTATIPMSVNSWDFFILPRSPLSP